jgi:hypothetical protein
MTTLGDRCKELNLDAVGTWDYAVPQPWALDVWKETSMWPNGIVWMYDRQSRIFGRPYAVSMYGWIVLQMYMLTKKQKGGGVTYD